MESTELVFEEVKITADCKYAVGTNKDYDRFYRDNYDSTHEVADDDMAEYDGYIVIIADGQPEWFNKELFEHIIKDNILE